MNNNNNNNNIIENGILQSMRSTIKKVGRIYAFLSSKKKKKKKKKQGKYLYFQIFVSNT